MKHIKLNAPDSNGWNYDYDFLKKLTDKVNDQNSFGEGLGMEEVEAVLLALDYNIPLISNEEINTLAQDEFPIYPILGTPHQHQHSVEEKRKIFIKGAKAVLKEIGVSTAHQSAEEASAKIFKNGTNDE